jgi:hypothetical protein
MIYEQGGFWHDQAMHNADDMEQGQEEQVHPNLAAPANAAPAAPEEQVDPVTPEVMDTCSVPEAPPAPLQFGTTTDPLQILRSLVASLNDSNVDTSKLEGIAFAGAKCSIIDSRGPTHTTRQCVIMVDTILPDNNASGSSVQIEEIQETQIPTAPARAKKQKKGPLVVTEVRRSNRLAGFAAGYKDKVSALAAEQTEQEGMGDVGANTNLATRFEAVIRDPDAEAPPHLPLSTVQAIGVEHCKMPLEAVSEAVMTKNSDNDNE